LTSPFSAAEEASGTYINENRELLGDQDDSFLLLAPIVMRCTIHFFVQAIHGFTLCEINFPIFAVKAARLSSITLQMPESFAAAIAIWEL
jgi:hypothetical protein